MQASEEGRKDTNHTVSRWLWATAVDMLVQGVKGLLELLSSMNLGGNLKAKLTQFFLGGHPLYLIGQAIHIGSHQINEAVLKELLLHDELFIQSLTN